MNIPQRKLVSKTKRYHNPQIAVLAESKKFVNKKKLQAITT